MDKDLQSVVDVVKILISFTDRVSSQLDEQNNHLKGINSHLQKLITLAEKREDKYND